MKAWVSRPLVLDDSSKALVADVVQFAEAHRMSIDTLKAVVAGDIEPPGSNSNFSCTVPIGYRCVYTIEQQPKLGWCRHLSVSVLNGPAPNEHAVNMLLKEFGFTCAVKPHEFVKLEPEFKGGWPDHLYTEPLAKGQVAVNIIQRMTESAEQRPTQ